MIRRFKGWSFWLLNDFVTISTLSCHGRIKILIVSRAKSLFNFDSLDGFSLFISLMLLWLLSKLFPIVIRIMSNKVVRGMRHLVRLSFEDFRFLLDWTTSNLLVWLGHILSRVNSCFLSVLLIITWKPSLFFLRMIKGFTRWFFMLP